MIRDNEKGVLITSLDVAQQLLENNKESASALIICVFAPPGTAIIAKYEDWKKLIDNGDVYERVKHE